MTRATQKKSERRTLNAVLDALGLRPDQEPEEGEAPDFTVPDERSASSSRASWETRTVNPRARGRALGGSALMNALAGEPTRAWESL
jgi:hypothetical protein